MAFDDFDYEENPVEDTSMSRVSYVAEPPTDPSRARALQQAMQEEKGMRQEAAHGGPGVHEAPAPQRTLSKPTLQQPGPQTAPVHQPSIPFVDLQSALNTDWEFDRLVREKLEGQHTDRAQLKNRVQNLAESHMAWQWQALDAVMGGGIALWEGLRSGGNRLLGKLPEIEAAATCKRVNQAKPIVIDLDDDEGDGTQPRRVESRDPGDEFSDLVASAAKEPIPSRIPRAELPSETPQGREGLTVSDTPTTLDAEGAAAKKTRPGDAKSCLAPSTAMTSSAASSLGALFAKNDARSGAEASNGLAPVKEDEDPATPEAKTKPPSKAKSVLAQSTVMSSSAAGALGSMLAKSSPARPPEAGGAQDSGAPSAPAASEPTPKKSGAKSVLNQSSAMTSSAAGALGGLLSQGSAPPTRTDPSAAGEAAPEAPPPKKASAAKSVLNQSTAMTSSAAGALGGLLSQGAAKAPPTRTEPPAGSSDAPATSAKASSEAPPAKKASGAKSVLNQSSTMTSSAAGALGGLLAQGGPKSSASMPAGSAGTASAAPAASAPPRSADDRKSALATSTVMTSSAAATLGALSAPKARPKEAPSAPASTQAAPASDAGAASAAAKPKASRPKGESKTVISGLNTSSAASALLGPMVQAKK